MASSVSVDPTLWWDSFSLLLTELENAPLSSDLPQDLANKLEDNHAWFVETVPLFKQSNAKSRDALNSQQVKIGSHTLTIQPELKEKALKFSSYIGLDEVQSYILVERTIEQKHVSIGSLVREFLHVVLLEYFVERQCLLKCTRDILLHALHVGGDFKEGDMRDKAMRLISDGLESKLIFVLQNLLSSSNPEQMELDVFTLWAEETLIEDNLVLDILFLAYYESFCTCNGETWRKMCILYKGVLFGSYNFGMLRISTEAINSSHRAKVQLLLILIETLDLEALLQMVHDETPFRQGTLIFTLDDVQETDVVISSFSTSEVKEAGPLILAWAVFLCLISSLPGKEENNVLMEIDHVGYVRQAFEAASLSYFLDILHSDLLKESEGPVGGYRSVLRTFISAFVASYEINLQLEDTTLNLILDILCNIYRGEESLCVQFWDKESFIDGPIRCLLFNLEGEFPFRNVELVRLLSSLSEGNWPAECVYNFLDKCVGISSLLEINGGKVVDNMHQLVESHHPLHVPGIEGLLIPGKTRGRVVKVIDQNTVLVRWEYTLSGLLVLLMRLARDRYLNNEKEVFVTFDLLSRMLSFNMAVCFSLRNITDSLDVRAVNVGGQMKNVWVVEVICMLLSNLSPNSNNAAVMSRGVIILSKMLKCFPSDVAAVALKANIFEVPKLNTSDVFYHDATSESWLLSGKLSKMLLIDCEQNDDDCPLTVSVLDFTMQLVEAGLESEEVLALIVICFQYILVNHEYWKYNVKHTRWKVTLKVLKLMKRCILSISNSKRQGDLVQDMLLSDCSIHNTLFRIVCTTRQSLERLYVSRLFEAMEIEGLESAICSVLDIFFTVLLKFLKDASSGPSVFHQALLSLTTKPVPVAEAVMSLLSYFRNPAMQVGAARVLSMLLMIGDSLQSYLSGNACFAFDEEQIGDLRHIVDFLFSEHSVWNEDLFVAVVNLLTAAALYQPSFLVAVLAPNEILDVQLTNIDGKQSNNDSSLGPLGDKKLNLVDTFLRYLERKNDLVNSPRLLLNVLNFLKALWQGAGQYTYILDRLKGSGNFCKYLSSCVSIITSKEVIRHENVTEMEATKIAYSYQCLSSILETLSYDVFLQKKLSHAESLIKSKAGSKDSENTKSAAPAGFQDMLSTWTESSVLSNLIKSFTSSEFQNDVHFRAKVAASLLAVHLMEKLASGDGGSLSISLLGEMRIMSKKLISQPAFSELSANYLQRGYSGGEELNTLILSDLYYHLQGELEGRDIGSGPFRELSLCLAESKLFFASQHNYDNDPFVTSRNAYLFDLEHIRADLGLDLWEYSGWKESTTIAEKMLQNMQEANTMLLLHSSKLTALKALITVLTVNQDNMLEKKTIIGGKIPDQPVLSWIDHICQCLHLTVESLASLDFSSHYVLDFLSAQLELLLLLLRSATKRLTLPICALVLKTSGFVLKVLSDIRNTITGVTKSMKLLLSILLSALEFCSHNSHPDVARDMECVEDFVKVSNASLGLLPILCKCITTVEHWSLSLTNVDLIINSFLRPNTWCPIIQKHLQLQLVVQKLQDNNTFGLVHILLKFFLTLARVREGAEMLLRSGFLSSLRVLFTQFWDASPFTDIDNSSSKSSSSVSWETEKPQQIWGLGLSVVTAIIQSLGHSCLDIMENVITYFFSEKAYVISYYLNAPDFPSDDHDKKRPRTQGTRISLTALKETEQTLMLMCVLAGHWNSWVKATNEVNSELREKCIHLLAFISRGNHCVGEISARTAPFTCSPILKEEFEYFQKPSFVNSKSGWFALSPLACVSKPRSCPISTTSLIMKGQITESSDQTYFSDIIALQIYRNTFLLLKFLCLQAEEAARRAEEVGYIDLAHFPELPMPEILHGLQDQTIAIIIELCEANKSKQIHPEIHNFCCLLLQIIEMTVYLELCVLQICGIRPVSGRAEDFSKEVKSLLKVVEEAAFLKASVNSLKQIISFVYPVLLRE